MKHSGGFWIKARACESKELSLGITGKKERNCHLALLERIKRKKAKFNLVGDTY